MKFGRFLPNKEGIELMSILYFFWQSAYNSFILNIYILPEINIKS